jgi:hypothetical protein
VAIYHCTTKPLSRSAGRSAIAAVAYRSGQSLIDERTGMVHDYTRKSGVMQSYTLLPSGEQCDRAKLWNAAELAEKRKDSRTAREWIIAIPSELVPNDEHRELISGSPDYDLVENFAQHLSKTYGVAVDVAIHAPDKKGSQKNYHAHILTTTRTATLDNGELVLGNKATIELSDKKRGELNLSKAKDEVKTVREVWASLANQMLATENETARIDHRSLKDQGIDRIPQIHVGVTATSMDRKGKPSERGERNHEIKQLNADIIDFQKARDRLWLKPDNIERRFNALVDQEQKKIDLYFDTLKRAQHKTRETWSTHLETKPTEPKGLLATFKRKQFEKAQADWLAEEKVLRGQRIDAGLQWEDRHHGLSAYHQAKTAFKKNHPDLYAAREKQIKRDEEKKITRKQTPGLSRNENQNQDDMER